MVVVAGGFAGLATTNSHPDTSTPAIEARVDLVQCAVHRSTLLDHVHKLFLDKMQLLGQAEELKRLLRRLVDENNAYNKEREHGLLQAVHLMDAVLRLC